MNAITNTEALALRTIPIRASSLGELFDCPARWEAKHIQGKRMPRSAPAQLGTAIHAGAAAFDAARLLGNPLSSDEAAAATVDAIYKPTEDVDWGDDSPDRAVGIALALHHKYCAEVAPSQTYVAVEATCEALAITDLGITLTGTVDRVYADEFGAHGISDIKTGKTAVSADGTVKTQGHGLQLAVYELLAELATGQAITAAPQIIGMQTGVTAKAQRIGIGHIDSPRDALIGTPETPGALQHASRLLQSGAFYGNPRSQLCAEKFCPNFKTCSFRK